GHSTVASRAFDKSRIDSVLQACAANRWAEASFLVRTRIETHRLAFGRYWAGLCFRHEGLRLNLLVADPSEQSAWHGLGIGIEENLRKHPSRRCRHFLRDLVGLKLDERIVLGDGIADLLEPGAHDRLGALLLVGNADFDQL